MKNFTETCRTFPELFSVEFVVFCDKKNDDSIFFLHKTMTIKQNQWEKRSEKYTWEE